MVAVKKGWVPLKFDLMAKKVFGDNKNQNQIKFLYPNATLLITFILLFIPSVNPFENLSSIKEFTIYGNQFFIALAASSNYFNPQLSHTFIHSFISSSAYS